ncbi:DNA topoisomerase IV subunit A [Aquaspirillum sp. LM1]|uniref:DNA topoisomerase IV subunit A n=1 Tax=Aquaspirillum sp. LM1 TaxID=1938604 RepID=UPI000983C107|nr:DNA topoisomerase IV subunit A [Aquaspirillum sp. LM1]AQR66308.1 DNA topoisomerase IV subunit A [Aquaspirillum sp. LM1]
MSKQFDPLSAPAAGGDDTLALDAYAERAYLEYAMSVVKGRALPEVADGQKPVQRRILYAMKEMGLTAGAKHVKSARVVGEILGKYHPHGDSSAYEAMVRLAQDFVMRYPLIDGQGNFGSRDGDGAAAMRYTEARLTPIAELLLSELDQGTVEFIPNYDGAFEEPQLLPARLPMVLLNGASGIAVGLATEIPPHNLREVASAAVALLHQPELSLDQLLTLIPGPDFPGGGRIITPAADIRQAYHSGRGSVRVRARWTIERLARNQWRVVVNELPPGTSSQKVLAEIEELTNPKVRPGKKALSAEQQNLKGLMLAQLDRVRDESDQQQPVRLVFEPKSSRQDPEAFITLLLAQTSLECNVSMNLVMIGLDGRPRQKDLKSILSEWLDFRMATLTRRLAHRLSKVNQRMHILEGRMTVFLHIEDVIHVIREADEPKPELMQRFGLSDVQAEDILDIRLRQLARLEGFKLEKELDALRGEAGSLRHLLDNPDARRGLMTDEINADAARYGDARRSEIKPADKAVLTQTVADEAISLIVSRNGWIRARSGHHVDTSTLTFKDGDAFGQVVETRTIHPVVVLDSRGRSYTLDSSDVPTGRGDGVPLTSLVEIQEQAKVVAVLSAADDSRYLVASSGGYGFTTQLKDMVSRVKAGKAFLSVEADETALPPLPLAASLPAHSQLVVASSASRVLAFALDELKQMARGRGLQLMPLEPGESVVALGVVHSGRALLSVQTPRSGRLDEVKLALADFTGKRGRRGKDTPKRYLVLAIADASQR